MCIHKLEDLGLMSLGLGLGWENVRLVSLVLTAVHCYSCRLQCYWLIMVMKACVPEVPYASLETPTAAGVDAMSTGDIHAGASKGVHVWPDGHNLQ